MIILFNRAGQTCNQVYAIASTIGRGHLYNHKICMPIIDNNLFNVFNIDLDERDYIGNSTILLFISKILNRIYKSHFDINTKKKNYIITDWKDAVDDYALKNDRDNILKKITFKSYDINTINKFFCENIRSKYIVGIHIRRGDYKEYLGGKYYYSDSDYLEWIRQIYMQEKNISFLIFSNENINIDKFGRNEYPIHIMRGTVGQDLYAMSKCTYIIGPPSTFSMWANYVGDNKLIVLKDSKQKIHI